jgi:hypothetical protein
MKNGIAGALQHYVEQFSVRLGMKFIEDDAVGIELCFVVYSANKALRSAASLL